jgi:hypothetical protein
MALISLSDWLDRFGDAPQAGPSNSELDSLRFAASEVPAAPAVERGEVKVRAGWRDRVRGACRRALWRLKRLPSGQT